MTEFSEPQGSPPPDAAPAEKTKDNALVVQDEKKAAPREIRVVADPIPILDTARFEHMQRIANVMAIGRLVPDTICKVKEGGQEVWLPFEAIQARCFMIVNQAVRWGMDPFAVAQTASFVHGRLMWEGKLIHAIIEAKLSIRLKYTFVNDEPNRSADDRRLGVVASGKFDDEDEARTIEGTVARWHRGDKTAWGNPADWKRQLRYMAAREWARAHAPGIILGVVTVEEVDPENPGFQNQQGPVPRRLAPPPPNTTESAPAAIEHKPAETIDAVEKAAGDLRQKAYAEAPAEVIKGKMPRKAPPPPGARTPEQKAFLQDLLDGIDKCRDEVAVVTYQNAHRAEIAALSADDRDNLIDAVEAKRAELAG